MKKIIFLLLGIVFIFSSGVYALDTQLLEVRNKFFQETREIKALQATPKNVLVINGMCDSCLMTISQLDAYFSMLGIFNSVTKPDAVKDSSNYLSSWLGEIKKSNDINIRGLQGALQLKDPSVTLHMDRLRIYYADLNNRIDSELRKVSLFAAKSITKQ